MNSLPPDWFFRRRLGRLVIVAALTMLGFGLSGAAAPASPVVTVAEVEAAVEKFVRAFEKRDVEAVVACFTPDAIVFDPWPPGHFENTAGVRTLFNTALGQMEKPSFTIGNAVTRVSGAIGWLTAQIAVGAEIDAKRDFAKAYLSMVWVKQPDGACRISVFHATIYEAPGAAADPPKK